MPEVLAQELQGMEIDREYTKRMTSEIDQIEWLKGKTSFLLRKSNDNAIAESLLDEKERTIIILRPHFRLTHNLGRLAAMVDLEVYRKADLEDAYSEWMAGAGERVKFPIAIYRNAMSHTEEVRRDKWNELEELTVRALLVVSRQLLHDFDSEVLQSSN